MPLSPFAGDDRNHLEDTIRAVKDHGGSVVPAVGMTMNGGQAPGTLLAAWRLGPGLAERLLLKTYDRELARSEDCRLWAYRRAARTEDECPDSIAELYAARAEADLRELRSIGPSLSKTLAGLLQDWNED